MGQANEQDCDEGVRTVAGLEHVARELGQLVRALKGLHHGVLADGDVRLELAAATVLGALSERGRLRLSQLAEVLHLDLSSVSRQVASLERQGHVARQRDPADSRAVLLELTDQGHAVLAAVRAARVEHLSRRLSGWTDDELEHFAGQLARLRGDLVGPGRDPAAAGCESPAPTDSDAQPQHRPQHEHHART